jgi:hypothetical protein
VNSRFLIFNSLKLATAITSFCLLCDFWSLNAQTNDASVRFPANRFLLVVETSRSMQRRVDAMAQTVTDLLQSAVASQARRGDTLGVWTFNEDVYSGVLPLQKWTPDTPKTISDRVVEFLKTQKFEKRARLDKLTTALDRVVHNSRFLTIIVVCLGDEEMHGTPFDARINGFFQTWRSQQQAAGTPFVIAFRAQEGAFVDCSMNPAPWPPELPALPKELFVPLVAAKPTNAPPNKTATSTVPPLIISGKKREPASNQTAEPMQPKAQVSSTGTTGAAIPSGPETTAAVPQSPPPLTKDSTSQLASSSHLVRPTGPTSSPIGDIASAPPAIQESAVTQKAPTGGTSSRESPSNAPTQSQTIPGTNQAAESVSSAPQKQEKEAGRSDAVSAPAPASSWTPKKLRWKLQLSLKAKALVLAFFYWQQGSFRWEPFWEQFGF